MNASSMFIFMLVVVKPLVQLNAIRKCVCVGGGTQMWGQSPVLHLVSSDRSSSSAAFMVSGDACVR